MKIIHESDKCIGCGSCVAICAKFWEMKEDGKSHLLGSKFDEKLNAEVIDIKEEAECVEEAVSICPVQCIKIEKLLN